MMWRQVPRWLVMALLGAGCAASGGTPISTADRCAQEGGRWIQAAETCERASGGGGGY